MTTAGLLARAPSRPGTRPLLVLGLLAAILGGCSPAAPRVPVGSPTAVAPTASTAAPDVAPVGATETARVVRIVDGDTIVVDRGRGNERLRYIGIDAPESVKPGTPVQFMAREASAANAALVAGRVVVLERDVSETDRYGRLLRYVWLRDGGSWTFVNLELVRRGFAHAVTFPPDVRWVDALRTAERTARDADAGLWGPATPGP